MTWILSQALMEQYASENSHSLPVEVEAYLEENSSDGEQFAPLNVMPTPHPFWLRDKTMDILSHSRFSQMSASLTESLGEDVLMWCREASRAKTSLLPEKAQESEESEVDCGERWLALSVKYDPATSGWKTHQCLFPEDLDWSCLTLPKWGMMSNGELWERTTQEPDTSGIGAGCWERRKEFRASIGRKYAPGSLAEQVTTPAIWPTPTVAEAQKISNKANYGQICLSNHPRIVGIPVRPKMEKSRGGVPGREIYPTITASDWKGAALDRAPGTENYRGNLCERIELSTGTLVRDQGSAMRLSPDWVEWLMGWPIGWTQLEGLEQMDWRDWSFDPADGLPPDMLGTPRATEAVRSSEFIKGRTPTPEEYIIATDRLQGGDVPRIATDIPNRIDRLRAIGNGQVPQAMVLAWNELTTNKGQ
jgi:hypothetical protein